MIRALSESRTWKVVSERAEPLFHSVLDQQNIYNHKENGHDTLLLAGLRRSRRRGRSILGGFQMAAHLVASAEQRAT